MPSVAFTVSSRYVTENQTVDHSHVQRQILPMQLMSNTASTSSEEGETFSSTSIPPPLPLQSPVGSGLINIEDEKELTIPHIKPQRRFIPDSWKNFFHRQVRDREPLFDFDFTLGAGECSPPMSPLLSRLKPKSLDLQTSEDESKSATKEKDSNLFISGKFNSPKENEASTSSGTVEKEPLSRQSYQEMIHVYNLKHSYMKSWAGLLRVLGVIQILFGAMVFACILAYIQKDSQWRNLHGGGFISYGFGNSYGNYYDGPKTTFVLVMVGLAWMVTVGLLVIGLTLYYRTILLDSNWWSITEFAINLCLFVLYLAAGIVYINDLNLGGICYTIMANNPLYSQLCRVEGGQSGAIAFLFVNMVLHLVSALVSLKVWRHEQTRREREALKNKSASAAGGRKTLFSPGPFASRDCVSRARPLRGRVGKFREDAAGTLNSAIPAGHIPRPHIVPDYVTKYPKIESMDEREQYKAVFNDQYAEYKELHIEIHLTLRKFQKLEQMIEALPRYTESQQEHRRITNVLEQYKRKKNDPSFLEKKERCTYLKNKLSYIKQRIQEYDLASSSQDNY
uniref:MARVEL domain-containing protein 2 n=1 Tax=Callorhinchus milii TaxID=7868 RepID=V9KE83_CALMI